MKYTGESHQFLCSQIESAGRTGDSNEAYMKATAYYEKVGHEPVNGRRELLTCW